LIATATGPMEIATRSKDGEVSKPRAAGIERHHPAAHPAVRVSIATLGFVAVTVVAMWPALTNSRMTLLGDIQPNDATAGGVWLAWQLRSLTPFATHTAALSAPHGVLFWHGTNITTLGWLLPLWFFAHLSSPVGAWDYTVALGFVADGLAMYGLVRWLVGRDWIAFVAGLLYAFSPFHMEESWAHLAYLYSWIFPLILWSGLALFRKPTVVRAVLFGGCTALAAYIDGYYVVFAPLFAAVLAACGLAWAPSIGIQRGKLARVLLSACGTYAVVVAPIVVIYLGAASQVATTFGRSQTTVYFYSAQLWEYVMPWSQSVVWGKLVSGSVNSLLGTGRGSGALERSLYLGGIVMLLGIGLGVALLRRSRIAHWERLRLPIRPLTWVLLATAIVLLVCSLAAVGPVPGFPILVWHLVPIWRAYTRLFVAVDCIVITAAAVALANLDLGKRRWLALVLAAAALIDGTGVLPQSTWSYAQNTALAYGWLSRHQDGGIVAEYPMLPSPEWANEVYLTYQPFYRHDLFNDAPPGSARLAVQRGLADLSDPQTIPSLRRLGVRYVLVDSYYYRRRPYSVALPTQGLHFIVSNFFVSLYRIGHVKPVIGMVTVNRGFYPEAPGVPHMHRWMSGSTASLGILPFSPWGRAEFHAQIRSFARSRELRITQNGRHLWAGRIPADTAKGSTVSIRVPVSRHGRLIFHASPGPTFARGYQVKHYFSLNVFDLSLSRVSSRRAGGVEGTAG
jgi:hypothetical protein